MKAAIKDIGVDLILKTRTMDIEVRDNQDKPKGTISINKAHIIWRKARHGKGNAIKVTLEDFIEYMEAKKK